MPVAAIVAVVGVLAIAAVAVGVTLALQGSPSKSSAEDGVTSVNDDSSTAAGIASEPDRPDPNYEPWGDAPVDSSVVVTRFNWRPDPNLIERLGSEERVGRYTIRPPEGFVRKPMKGTFERGNDARWELRGQDGKSLGSLVVGSMQRRNPPSTWVERDVLSAKTPSHDRYTVERGRLNGWPAVRNISTWTSSRTGGSTRMCMYHVVLDGEWLLLIGRYQGGHDSLDAKTMETAIRSIRLAVAN